MVRYLSSISQQSHTSAPTDILIIWLKVIIAPLHYR